MCLMALALAVTMSAFAQTVAVAQLSGTVIDDSGGALPGVEVTVKKTGTGMTRFVVSGSSGDYLFTLYGHAGMVNCVAYSPDGEHIASGGDDKTVKIWNGEKAPEARILGGPDRNWFTHVAFDPNGKKLAASNADGKVTVWDLPRYDNEVKALFTSPDPILSARVAAGVGNAGGETALSACEDEVR